MNGEHYFSANPASPHRQHQIYLDFQGRRLTFTTDAGVFSREAVDRGTRLLLAVLAVPGYARLLVDLGCGYGPIGLALACLAPQARVFLIDPNARACELALANARQNGLSNVAIRQGEGLAAVDGPIDLVAINPPIRAGKKVVYGLMAEAAARLKPGGELWTVIRTNQGAKSLAAELGRLFPEVDEIEKGGGFRVYRARRGVADARR